MVKFQLTASAGVTLRVTGARLTVPTRAPSAFVHTMLRNTHAAGGVSSAMVTVPLTTLVGNGTAKLDVPTPEVVVIDGGRVGRVARTGGPERERLVAADRSLDDRQLGVANVGVRTRVVGAGDQDGRDRLVATLVVIVDPGGAGDGRDTGEVGQLE